jgi:thiopeptide-type bacteriocin biosynthesis protein
MNYKVGPHLLLRMPVKNPLDYRLEPQHFLDDQLFRAAILVATPAFYAILYREKFQAAALSEKQANTLQKYINRFCYRPTPFALFSTVCLVEWNSNINTQTVSPKFKIDVRAAMPLQNIIGRYLVEHELNQQSTFETNPSLYRVVNEYRFFRTGFDETGKERHYQLQSIAFSKLLKDLLSQCDTGCDRQKIVDQIIRSADCLREEAEDYTDFLIDAQLLVNRLRLTITGKDYLTHLTETLNEGQPKNKLLRILARQNAEKQIAIGPAFIAHLEQDLNTLLPQNEMPQEKLSIILQQDVAEGTLELKFQERLGDGIAALELLSPTAQSATMSQFMKHFQKHFEGQTLPLLQALDPEAGVGYQHPETERDNPLLETLNIPYQKQTGQGGTWSSAHSLLMEIWLRDKSADPVIRLQPSDLERLQSRVKFEPILGMSVLFRIAENKVFIENAGGINAPALMGRFTVADEQIAGAAQAMARQLELKNPDIIFTELLHLADPHTDNINRRAHIYHYELPITAPSTLPIGQQLQLSDLYIRVIDNKVMLFSERHQKIVIPRLTSAYNHNLNKLPLFRFLADLPYQYGRSTLGLDLRQFFPDLRFYPRTEYKDTILSLATWIIKENQIVALQDEQNNGVEAFKELGKTIHLPPYFSLVEGDQELVFDGQSERDITFFLRCIRQKKEAVLKEFLQQPIVRQYNAYLLPDEPLVLPQPGSLRRPKASVQRKYIPGSEWLYLKIYAPKIGVNRLLQRLAPLLHKRYGEHKVRQWFFIRYEDHAPHIRLRLQVNPDSVNEVLQAFKAKLEDRIQQHVIREFQIDVYNRELERYALGGIENTERLFWASSELVLSFLKQGKTKRMVNTHSFALYSTLVIISRFISDPEKQITFTLDSFQQLLPEFTDVTIKVDLDKKYRELSPGITAAFADSDQAIRSGSIKAGKNFLSSLQEIAKTMGRMPEMGYVRSIIHVHLNRIFTDEPRKQEMICYYLLHKHLLSVKGRNKFLSKFS